MSGHSTRTAVVTSRLAIADIAHLHHEAERSDTTVSALVARIVHEHAGQLNAQPADQQWLKTATAEQIDSALAAGELDRLLGVKR